MALGILALGIMELGILTPNHSKHDIMVAIMGKSRLTLPSRAFSNLIEFRLRGFSSSPARKIMRVSSLISGVSKVHRKQYGSA